MLWTTVCLSMPLPIKYLPTSCVLFFQHPLLWFLSQERFHGPWPLGGSLGGACCDGLCSRTSREKPSRELSRSRSTSANQTERNSQVNLDLKIPRYSLRTGKNRRFLLYTNPLYCINAKIFLFYCSNVNQGFVVSSNQL